MWYEIEAFTAQTYQRKIRTHSKNIGKVCMSLYCEKAASCRVLRFCRIHVHIAESRKTDKLAPCSSFIISAVVKAYHLIATGTYYVVCLTDG